MNFRGSGGLRRVRWVDNANLKQSHTDTVYIHSSKARPIVGKYSQHDVDCSALLWPCLLLARQEQAAMRSKMLQRSESHFLHELFHIAWNRRPEKHNVAAPSHYRGPKNDMTIQAKN